MYLLAREAEKLGRLGIRVFVKTRSPQNRDKVSLASVEGTTPTQNDGYFAGNDAKAFAILVAIKSDDGGNVRLVIPEEKDGKKLKKFLSPHYRFENQDISVRLVSTYDVYGGRSTKPQDNSVTIILTKKNILQVFSAGIVTRIDNSGQSQYFLVIQEMYKAKLYREEITDKVAVKDSEYDGYKKWPDLQKIVEEMVKSHELPTLPKTTGSAASNDITADGLENGQGRVLFFDIRKGFGMSLTKDHPKDGVYFHWRQTDTNDRLPYFEGGQLITYAAVYETSKGLQLLGVKTT